MGVAAGVGVGIGVGVAKMFGATVGIIEVGHGLLPMDVVVLGKGLLAGGDVAVLPIDDVLPAVAGTLKVVVGVQGVVLLFGGPPSVPAAEVDAPAAPAGRVVELWPGKLLGAAWLGVVVVAWLGVVVVVWLGVVVVVWLGVAPAGVVVWAPAGVVTWDPAGVVLRAVAGGPDRTCAADTVSHPAISVAAISEYRVPRMIDSWVRTGERKRTQLLCDMRRFSLALDAWFLHEGLPLCSYPGNGLWKLSSMECKAAHKCHHDGGLRGSRPLCPLPRGYRAQTRLVESPAGKSVQ